VRPLTVVLPHVLVENTFKMTTSQIRIQSRHLDRPHPALSDRVGVRRLNRRLDDLGAVGGERVVEGAGELGVPVTNKEPRHDGALQRFHLYRTLPCTLDDQAPFGWSVTPATRTCRVGSSMKNKT
jgi:hypothetical protein